MKASRISTMSVMGLFGYLNHEINMDESGLTFIHGPNGCGKTTILNILSLIFSSEVHNLKEIVFKKITIKFCDGSVLQIERNLDPIDVCGFDMFHDKSCDDEFTNITIQFTYTDHKKKKYDPFEIKCPSNESLLSTKIIYSEIPRRLPYLQRIAPRRWRNLKTRESFSTEELIRRYSHLLGGESPEIPSWFISLRENNKIQYIKTQRLFTPGSEENDDKRFSDAIQVYSIELKKMISEKLAEQAAASQGFDSTFPERLLVGEIHSEGEERIRERYGKIEIQTKELVEAGLINKQRQIPLPEIKLRPDQINVMTLYLDDMEEKLSVFSELQQKIKTFLGIVATKLHGKIFSIDRNVGFLITAKQTMQSGGSIILRPTQLSSGEQHQIVLFYELIFKAEKCSLFLIDEPEISLHVDWQRQFVEDILQVKNIGNSSFLIATHSPQIIGTHFCKARALNGGILEEAH